MADLTKSPSHVAQLGYSGFDMSQLLKFSSSTGHLLPVYYDLLYPGDKVTMSSELKTRTQPLMSAAMCDIKEHIDWFAVPLDQIYSLFSTWYYGVNDIHSSLISQGAVQTILPYVSASALSSVWSDICNDPGYTFAGTHDVSLGEGLRLFELLGIPLYDYNGIDRELPFSFNPMFFCAYQKIYFDYYRLSDREQNNPLAYNLDKHYDVPDLYDSLGSNLIDMFKIRYRSWAKDFFTLGYVSPLFGSGDISAYPDASYKLEQQCHQWLTSETNFSAANPDGTSGLNNVNTQLQVGRISSSNENWRKQLQQQFSPQAIRTSFAANKLLEITRRAGKRLDKQTLAHFGVKPSSAAAGEVEYLGGATSHVLIGDVIATAQTDAEGGALGRVGGKGYGYDKSKQFKYENNHTCPVILMAIYSAEPAVDYRAVGFERLNTYLTGADFMRPEYDNLGMQPLFRYQTLLYPYKDNQQTLLNSAILNWQYRWQESKMKYNRICGSLARSLDVWTTYRDYMDATLSSYLVSPFVLDSIMVYDYHLNPYADNFINILSDPGSAGSSTKSSLFDADPLLHELYFNVFKSSTMSSYGLESL